MTAKEIDQYMAGLTSADDATKERILKRFYHYKSCSDVELITSCNIIEGMQSAADGLRDEIKRLKDELLDARNALTIFTKTVRDTRDAQKAFHKSKKSSREWNDNLRLSKILEAETDKFLKVSWLKIHEQEQPPSLFK